MGAKSPAEWEAGSLTNSPEAIQQALEPYMGALWACAAGGVFDYLSLDPQHRAIDSARTRANRIYDFMLHRARREFAGVPQVRFIERRGLVSLLIEDRFNIRFKKLNKRYLPSNYPTQQAIQMLHQVELDLPDLPPVIKLIVGYRLNDLQTNLQGVYLVCPAGLHQNKWVAPLARPVGYNNVVPFPSVAAAPAKEVTVRVRLKEKRTENASSEGASSERP